MKRIDKTMTVAAAVMLACSLIAVTGIPARSATPDVVPATKAAPGKRAVVIGLNRTKSMPNGSLKGAVNDALMMTEMFSNQGFTVTTLLDDQATRARIIEVLKDVAKTETGTFVLYFSGNAYPGNRAGTELIAFDAEPAKKGGRLEAAELNDLVEGIPARSRYIIADACYVAGIVRPGTINYVLSCSGDQVAFEDVMPDGKTHGAFTYRFIEATKSKGGWGTFPLAPIVSDIAASLATVAKAPVVRNQVPLYFPATHAAKGSK